MQTATRKDKIKEYFPFPTFREGQLECIEFILDSFDSDKQFVIVEAPTGAGKSAIGLTIARFFNDAYYLTVQKILQSQIIKDFCTPPEMSEVKTLLDTNTPLPDTDGYEQSKDIVVDLKGRATYPCTFYDRMGDKLVGKALKQSQLEKFKADPPNCGDGYCRKKGDFKCIHCFSSNSSDPNPYGVLPQLPPGVKFSTCPYYEQIGKALSAHTCLMNFASFLYQTTMTTRFDARDLLIVDECHQLEPSLLNFVSTTVNDKELQKLGFKLEHFDTPIEYCLFFIENEILDKLGKLWQDAKDTDKPAKIQDEYNQVYRKVHTFIKAMENEEEWVAEYTDNKDYRTVSLKPVFVRNKASSLVFNKANKILLMSATILDPQVYCNTLGIQSRTVESYRMKNRFPVKNRPIRLRSAGRLTGGRAKMPQWAPKVVEQADKIISEYPNERGIIHTHNFAISNLLLDKSKHKARFLFQKRFKDKETMLEKHGRSSNTIIVAPAMHEGLDLKDDLSRFQIICKVPWPNFIDDKQLARRVEIDRRYYLWLTALKLVQSYGRSVRSEDDWADTYVLDEVFTKFIKDARSLLPTWFHEAIDLKS